MHAEYIEIFLLYQLVGVTFLFLFFLDDWEGTIGNPGKLGLSFISMIYSCIFITQHFILYPKSSRKRQKSDSQMNEFLVKLEDFKMSTVITPLKKSTSHQRMQDLWPCSATVILMGFYFQFYCLHNFSIKIVVFHRQVGHFKAQGTHPTVHMHMLPKYGWNYHTCMGPPLMI